MTAALLSDKPRLRYFRPSYRGPKFSLDRAKRQGQITHLAFSLLGTRERAIAFLNSPNPTLGGRPLDLAIASPEGYALVEYAIGFLATPHLGAKQ